jgi:hypothetical protein
MYYTGKTKLWPNGIYKHATRDAGVRIIKTDTGLYVCSVNQFFEPIPFTFLLLQYELCENLQTSK